MLDSLTVLAPALRLAPVLVLLWLAFFFGRTLRSGAMPLVERIARAGMPALSDALCRYTRRLTAVWFGYFLAAAALTATAGHGFGSSSAWVASASLLLFVGEHRLRRRLFPSERFPGLLGQVRDTVRVWRTRGGN